MRSIVSFMVAVSLSACATHPQPSSAPQPATPPATSQPQGALQPTAAITSATPPSTAADASGPKASAELVKQGYRAKKMRDEWYYCRAQTQTGTHFSSTVCQTEAQIRQAERDARDSLTHATNRAGSACAPGGACN